MRDDLSPPERYQPGLYLKRPAEFRIYRKRRIKKWKEKREFSLQSILKVTWKVSRYYFFVKGRDSGQLVIIFNKYLNSLLTFEPTKNTDMRKLIVILLAASLLNSCSDKVDDDILVSSG